MVSAPIHSVHTKQTESLHPVRPSTSQFPQSEPCVVSLPDSRTALGTVRLLSPQQFSLEMGGMGGGVAWGLALLSLEVPGGLVKTTRKKLTPDCPWCLRLLVWMEDLGMWHSRSPLNLAHRTYFDLYSVTNNQTKADSHRVLLLFMLECRCWGPDRVLDSALTGQTVSRFTKLNYFMA